MITIYSDDPRGVSAAVKEETAKGNKVRLRDARHRPVQARTEAQADDADDIAKMTKAQLQQALTDAGIEFEGDANKPRLLELLKGASE